MNDLSQYRAAVQAAADVRTPTRFGAAAHAARRAVIRALRHYDEHQQRRCAMTLDAVDALSRSSESATRRLSAEVAHLRTAVNSLRAEVDEAKELLDGLRLQADAATRGADVARTDVVQLTSRLDSEVSGRLDSIQASNESLFAEAQQTHKTLSARTYESGAAIDGLERTVADLRGRVAGHDAQVQGLVADLYAPPYTSDAGALRITGPDGRQRLGYRSRDEVPTLPGADGYAGFEDLFRGTEQFVLDRHRVYLNLLRDAAPVLDLGCGRGELLRLLAAERVRARGVDLDEGMIGRCRGYGLDVTWGDAGAALAAAEPGSLGAVVALQMIEHLPPDSLPALFGVARRALRPGGVLVCETVNPHSPGALRTFWLDMTHRHPLYPEAVLLCARSAGFPVAEILFPHGSGNLANDLTSAGEYALVARLPS